MDFGRLNQISHLRFELPPEDPSTVQYLSDNPRSSIPLIYIGAPIWTHKEWVGKIYPPKTQPRDFLRQYAEQFNSIELNSSFYSLPSNEQVKNWQETVPSHFKFSPKFPQSISRALRDASVTEIRTAFETFLGFEENLGLSFMQLPPHFSPREIPVLRNFFRHIPKGFQLAVELRHENWFFNHAMIPEAEALFAEFGVSSVISDVAGRRDVLHSTLRTHQVLIRFNGHGLHPTDYLRIEDWADRIVGWVKAGVHTVYFFIHQVDPLTMPDLAIDLIGRINRGLDLHVTPPKWLDANAAEQMILFS